MSEPYYEDEQVTLYHGDCLEVDEWLNADVLVTDPPYGYNHSSNRNGPYQKQAIANDIDTTARDEVLAAWSPKPALVFGSWKRIRPSDAHTLLIWDKGDAVGMGDLSVPWKPNTEEIYVIGKGFSGRRDSSVLRAKVVTWASKGRDHPNMKPVPLLERLVDKCPPGTVADPFAGSGSTLIATRNLGRHAIGVELEERYCEIIASRLSQACFDFGEGA